MSTCKVEPPCPHQHTASFGLVTFVIRLTYLGENQHIKLERRDGMAARCKTV